jgi:hypothetical protein
MEITSAGSTQASEKTNREKAIEYCTKLIDYYQSNRSSNRNAFYISQVATVFLSAATPILVLNEDVPKIISAIPPAVASITAGLAVFGWQENWISSKNTQEALEAELIAFELCVGKYGKENQAVNDFIHQINTLHLTQVKEWSTVSLRKPPTPIAQEEADPEKAAKEKAAQEKVDKDSSNT